VVVERMIASLDRRWLDGTIPEVGARVRRALAAAVADDDPGPTDRTT
jgi:hypothetical protein